MALTKAHSHLEQSSDQSHSSGNFWGLVIGCIGVVYGDIGTSPLYAFREAVTAAERNGLPLEDSVFGVLSLIVWVLILIVTLKYVLLLLYADNKGEGGTFALMALGQSVAKRSAPLILCLGIAGACFFYGDAVITPAISVMAAVEGLELISHSLTPWVLPLSLLIIFGLFAVQSVGTEKVSFVFGPITGIWFLCVAAGGASHIFDNLSVLQALNPIYGITFAIGNGFIGLTVMGLVFLAVTGAEALYADLGHFGRKPIQVAWLWFIFPALLLNYFGQAALVLSNPSAIENPFYLLYPEWALVPVLILATAATVIASQAVITGTFSLTRQAVQLGLLPRIAIRHTSAKMAGQIYLPRINWLLLSSVVLVIIQFRSSSALASAYGVSVTAAMLIDSLMAFFVIWKLWGGNFTRSLTIMLPLATIELVFLLANMTKILDGGWLPLLIAGTVAIVIATWIKGYKNLTKEIRRNEADLDWLVRKLEQTKPVRVSGTAVFFSLDTDFAPMSLLHNLKHNRALHERNIILSIRTKDIPRVPRHERITIDKSTAPFIKVMASYGFMESPNVPKILEHCLQKGLDVELSATSFFLSRRVIRLASRSDMWLLQRQLFIFLTHIAEDATTYFRIPTDRVVEIGSQVAI